MAGLMGLNWQQQKELMKLRSKLSLRQFMGEKAKIITALTTIFLLVPFTVGLAIATGVGYLFLPDQWPTQLLGFVLILSWLIWSIAPVLSFNVNEGLDPTRLLIYPVSRRDFLAHLLLGTLLDYPTYFLIPFVIAIIVGFGLGLALPVVLIAVFLTYLLMVLTSQMIINTVGGILRSRRFRDISILIGAFFGFGCWFISSSLQEIIPRVLDIAPGTVVNYLVNGHPLELLKWLPPGAAAKSIEQATTGAWGGALLWLGYTILWVFALGWLWWRVTYRVVTGEGFLLGGRPTAEKSKTTKSRKERGGLFIWDWIPADIRELALKDLKLKWRIPQSRIGVLYMYMLPVFTAVYPLFLSQSNENSSIPSSVSNGFVVGGTAIYTLFVFWANGQNMLGWETTGLANLLLTPLPRQRVFLGKALAQFLMNMPPILVLITIAIIRQPDLVSFSLLTTTIGLGLACTAVVSNFSALFPYPVNIEKQSGQNPFAGGGGCLTGLANGTLMPLMIAIFCLPGALPLVIALFTGLDWLALVGAVLTPVYGAVIFWFGTKLAGRLLLQREPEVLIATRPKEDRG
jgi:ABC-2 type transport system permease protein